MANDAYGNPDNRAHQYIYLYYMKPNASHDRQIEVYFIDQVQPIEVNYDIIYDLVGKADNKTIVPHAYGIAGIDWLYESYLVFVSKSNEFVFKEGDAVEFDYYDILPWPFGNHTFKHGQDIPTMKPISGFWCVNKRQRKGGGYLGDETEKFKVTIPGLSEMKRERLSFVKLLLLPFIKLLLLLQILSHNEVGSNTGP